MGTSNMSELRVTRRLKPGDEEGDAFLRWVEEEALGKHPECAPAFIAGLKDLPVMGTHVPKEYKGVPFWDTNGTREPFAGTGRSSWVYNPAGEVGSFIKGRFGVRASQCIEDVGRTSTHFVNIVALLNEAELAFTQVAFGRWLPENLLTPEGSRWIRMGHFEAPSQLGDDSYTLRAEGEALKSLAEGKALHWLTPLLDGPLLHAAKHDRPRRRNMNNRNRYSQRW